MTSKTRSAKVLTVSDGVAQGTRTDNSGLALTDFLASNGFTVSEHRVCADGIETVAATLREMITGFAGLVVTTGGTGFGPRDLTPEGTVQVIERSAPGMVEAIRQMSDRDGRNFGMLSRGICGTVDATLICNLPGSTAGALEALGVILPALPHALDLLGGKRLH